MAKNLEILRSLSLNVADPHDAFIMYACKEPRLSFHDCLEWFSDGCILGKTLNHLTLKTCFMRISNGSTSISERSLDVLLTSVAPLYGFDHTSLDNAQCKAEILSRLYDKRPLRSLRKPFKSVSESHKMTSPNHRGSVAERRLKLFDVTPAPVTSTSPPHSGSPTPGGAIRGGEPLLSAKRTGSGPHTIFGGGLKRINASDDTSINSSTNHLSSSNMSMCFPADLAEWERTLHATDSNDDNNNTDNITLYGTRNVHVNQSDLMSSMNLEDDDYFVDSVYLEGVDSTDSVQLEGRTFGSEISYDRGSSCSGRPSERTYSLDNYFSGDTGLTLGDKSHAMHVCSLCGSTLANNFVEISPSCTECSEASFDVNAILTRDVEDEAMNDINNDDIMGKVDAIIAETKWKKGMVFGKGRTEEQKVVSEGVKENILANVVHNDQHGDHSQPLEDGHEDTPVAMGDRVDAPEAKGSIEEVAKKTSAKHVAYVDH